MMIVLTVLKWIGIILLVLLLLILFLLFLLLFVPFRYELLFAREKEEIPIAAQPPEGSAGEEKKKERRFLLTGNVTWLFRLLRIVVAFDNDGLSYHGRFGPMPFLSSEEEEAEETESREESSFADSSGEMDSMPQMEEALAEEPMDASEGGGPLEETSKQEPAEKPAEEAVGTSEEVSELEESPVQATEEKAAAEEPANVSKENSALEEKATEEPSLSEEKGAGLRKVQAVLAKIREVTSAENRRMIGLVFKELLYILKHGKVRMLQGELAIGMEDPYVMGQILSVLSVTYPLHGRDLLIRPYFDRQEISGEVRLRGYLRLLHVLLAGIRLFMDPGIRHMIFKR